MGVPDKRIVIVPNAISGAYIDSVPASSDAVDILFVGRLIGHKRADLVIDAVSEIPDATLRIVGSGPERESLEQRAIDKECASRVIFAGDVAEHEDVIALMKAARVVALPSEREGFGIAVAEALACGTPVVTSNHPDNEARHLVDDGVDGSVIEAGSVVELRKALSRWRQPDHARSSLRSSFWAHHGDLEWDQVAENYLNALISLGKR
jgi:glycosyltransferase involved in cell wall biosynthesis